jgi:hypothetical protein
MQSTKCHWSPDFDATAGNFDNWIFVVGITIYSVETSPTLRNLTAEEPVKLIHILGSESLLKPFWWAQWSPVHEFLAFLYTPTRRQSSYDDDEESTSTQIIIKPLLSVLQFHEKFPRESVVRIK